MSLSIIYDVGSGEPLNILTPFGLFSLAGPKSTPGVADESFTTWYFTVLTFKTNVGFMVAPLYEIYVKASVSLLSVFCEYVVPLTFHS